MQDLTDRINYLTDELDRVRGLAMSASPGIDAAKREQPVEGLITIPSRYDSGQDGFVRVSKDGVVVSYANPAEGFFPYVDLVAVGNVGAGLDDLQKVAIPINALQRNGDYFKVRYWGGFAANDTDKAVNAFFDNISYENTGALDIDGGQWLIDAEIVRTGPKSINVSHIMTWFAVNVDSLNNLTAFGTGYFDVTRVALSNITNNLNTTSITMGCRGQGAADNDVVQFSTTIELIRPNTRKLT